MNGKAGTIKRQRKGSALIKEHVLREYKVGDRLPTAEILSKHVGTSEYAAVRAMTELSAEGVVERKPRVGTYLISNGGGQRGVRNGIPMIVFVADNLEFYMEVVSGIEEGCRHNNMGAALVKSEFDPKLEFSHLEELLQDGYAGAIVRQSWYPSTLAAVNHLVKAGFPVVLIDNKNDDKLDVPCVRPDHEKAAYDATKHLIELGHRRIGHVTEHADVARRMELIREAEAGYRRALMEAGIEIHLEYISRASHYVAENEVGSLKLIEMIGYEPTHRLLSLPEPPTALTFGHYWLGVTGFQAVQNHGLKVPEDISLIGIDGDGPEFRYMPVPMTTMAEEKGAIGKTAAEIMGKLITGEKISEKLAKIQSKLIVRQSTAPPKNEN